MAKRFKIVLTVDYDESAPMPTSDDLHRSVLNAIGEGLLGGVGDDSIVEDWDVTIED